MLVLLINVSSIYVKYKDVYLQNLVKMGGGESKKTKVETCLSQCVLYTYILQIDVLYTYILQIDVTYKIILSECCLFMLIKLPVRMLLSKGVLNNLTPVNFSTYDYEF